MKSKKFLFILAFIMILTVCLAACGESVVYHTVRFDPDNSEKITYKSVEYGSLLEKPEDPVKEGYNFKGWYFNGSPWNFETDKLTTDLTLTAMWARIVYTVTFDSDGGNTVEEQLVEQNGLAVKPQNPTKQHNRFMGWYIGDELWDFNNAKVTENLTLKAKWEPSPTHTVTFDSNGGSSIEPRYVIENDKLPLINPPQRAGYSFIEWRVKNSERVWNFDTDVVTSDITLVAMWYKLPVYTVSFNSDGGSAVDAQQIIQGNKLAAVPTPEKEGFDFAGWVDENNNPVDVSNYTPTKNTTLKAKWTIKSGYEYTVTFDSDNGASPTAEQVAYGSTVARPDDPTKQNNKFLGWYCGDTLWNFENKISQSITLKAKWTEHQTYTVTFENDDGALIATQYVIPGGKVNLNVSASKDGYIFVGWFVGELQWRETDTVNGNVTLTAKWRLPNVYTITFNTGGGTEIEPITVVEGQKIPAVETPVNGRYSFEGWLDSAGNKIDFTTYIVTNNITLTADWVLKLPIHVFPPAPS